MRRWIRASALGIGVTVLAGCGETTDPDPTNPDQVSQQVGAAGGVIMSKDSNLTLIIPPGALSGEVTITIAPVAPEDLGTEWDGLDLDIEQAYGLGPDGLTFASPVTVAFETDQEPGQPGQLLVEAGLLFVSSGSSIEALDSLRVERRDDAMVVAGELSHFSIVGRTFDYIRFEATVPDQVVAEQEFDVVLRVTQQRPAILTVEYTDRSLPPIQPIGIPTGASQNLPALPGGNAWGATLRYVCMAPPDGLWRMEMLAELLSPELFLAFYIERYEGPSPDNYINERDPLAREVTCSPALRELTVTTVGEGTVTTADATIPSIACGPNQTCSADYVDGAAVRLIATAADGWEFAGWVGDGCQPDAADPQAALVEMTTSRTCEARFAPIPMVTATVTVQGGTGTTASVDVSPLGETCAKTAAEVVASCVYSLVQGTVLTLTAGAGANTEFVHWLSDGVVATTAAALVVTMTGSKVFDAVFQAIEASPLGFLARRVLSFRSDALAAGRPAGAGAHAGNGGASAALADLTSVFVADAGTSGDVLELNLSDPATITEAGSGGLCEGVTAVVHADHPSFAEGQVFGFSGTVQWSCVTGYPLGQSIGLFNMGSPTGKAMLMPGNASTVLVAHWGAGALARLTPTTSDFVALVPGVRSCPRFLKATTTEVYLVTVEGTVGTASEPCNSNRGLRRVRLSDNAVTGFAPFGTQPRDPVISADGSTIYVPDYAEDRIHVVAAASMTVTRTIDVPGGPVAAVLTADGTHLIVARWDLGDIAMVNVATGEVAGNIGSGGRHPTALLLGPDNVVAVLNYGDPDTATNGSVATFRYSIP